MALRVHAHEYTLLSECEWSVNLPSDGGSGRRECSTPTPQCVPLAALEALITNGGGPIYRVLHHAETCTTFVPLIMLKLAWLTFRITQNNAPACGLNDYRTQQTSLQSFARHGACATHSSALPYLNLRSLEPCLACMHRHTGCGNIMIVVVILVVLRSGSRVDVSLRVRVPLESTAAIMAVTLCMPWLRLSSFSSCMPGVMVVVAEVMPTVHA